MSKFTINTREGLKQVDAIPFRFTSPGWLRRFRFITHLTESTLRNPGYSMTDIKTGRSISSFCATRAEAKAEGHERILVIGKADFLKIRKAHALKRSEVYGHTD